MKLVEFINQNAAKSGLPADNEALNTFVSSLPDVDMPDDVIKPITTYQSTLMTPEAAKNNTELISHFRATNLGGVDEEVAKHVSGLNPEQTTALTNETNSYKKIGLLTTFNKANADKAIAEASSGDVDITKYTTQIDELNKKLGESSKDWEQKLSVKEQEWAAKLRTNELKIKLTSLEYANGWTAEDGALVVQNKINTYLQSKGWNLTDNGAITTSEGTKAFEDNAEVSYQGVVDKIAAPYLKKHSKDTPLANPNQMVFKSETPNAFLDSIHEG